MAKQSEVQVGQVWTARVGGNFRKVKVTSVVTPDKDKPWNAGKKVRFGLTNLGTGRTLSPRTAAFLRRLVS